jgi:predicted DNA-binding transcriptional regulator YafY
MLKAPVIIKYKNYRGEVSERRILPGQIEYIKTPWYDLQWVLHAWDYTKEADRTFAITNILEWKEVA